MVSRPSSAVIEVGLEFVDHRIDAVEDAAGHLVDDVDRVHRAVAAEDVVADGVLGHDLAAAEGDHAVLVDPQADSHHVLRVGLRVEVDGPQDQDKALRMGVVRREGHELGAGVFGEQHLRGLLGHAGGLGQPLLHPGGGPVHVDPDVALDLRTERVGVDLGPFDPAARAPAVQTERVDEPAAVPEAFVVDGALLGVNGHGLTP
jgi:hypothetical protein